MLNQPEGDQTSNLKEYLRAFSARLNQIDRICDLVSDPQLRPKLDARLKAMLLADGPSPDFTPEEKAILKAQLEPHLGAQAMADIFPDGPICPTCLAHSNTPHE